MSSYRFISFDEGPPHNSDFSVKDVVIKLDGSYDNGWVCEHRWLCFPLMFLPWSKVLYILKKLRDKFMKNWDITFTSVRIRTCQPLFLGHAAILFNSDVNYVTLVSFVPIFQQTVLLNIEQENTILTRTTVWIKGSARDVRFLLFKVKMCFVLWINYKLINQTWLTHILYGHFIICFWVWNSMNLYQRICSGLPQIHHCIHIHDIENDLYIDWL